MAYSNSEAVPRPWRQTVREIEGIERVIKTLEPYWEEIEKEFEEKNSNFIELIAADHDAIGRVLRCHLVIENFMTTFLMAHFEVENIKEARLSFAQKARLLPLRGVSASFVRPGILQINTVRNKYGHQLNHQVDRGEIQGIYEVLAIARPSQTFDDPLSAIEAFTPVACAFLSLSPKHIQDLFLEAFKDVRPFGS